jgi:hypothetical protein
MQNESELIVDNKFMNLVRDIRNVLAHSDCLINKLSKGLEGKTNRRIIYFVKNMNFAGKTLITNNLSKNFTYNFIVLLHVYDNVVTSQGVKKRLVFIRSVHNNMALHNSFE